MILLVIFRSNRPHRATLLPVAVVKRLVYVCKLLADAASGKEMVSVRYRRRIISPWRGTSNSLV